MAAAAAAIAVFLASVTLSSGQQIPNETWGYVTVRPEAHMFWWLYGSTASDRDTRPLVMWLQVNTHVMISTLLSDCLTTSCHTFSYKLTRTIYFSWRLREILLSCIYAWVSCAYIAFLYVHTGWTRRILDRIRQFPGTGTFGFEPQTKEHYLGKPLFYIYIIVELDYMYILCIDQWVSKIHCSVLLPLSFLSPP